MNGQRRFFWSLAAVLVYVCIAAGHAAPSPLPWIALVALPALLAEAFRRSAAPRDQQPAPQTTRGVLRATVFGVLLWAAARSGPAGREALDAIANLGVGITAVASLVALARIESIGGILSTPKTARSLDAAGFAAFLWAIATALPLGLALLPSGRVRLDPLAVDYATTSAGLGSLFLCVAASARLRALRRLELGVGDRASGALALSCSAVLVAVLAALFDVAPPDRILPAAVALAALGMTWAATTPEPTTVPHVLRGVLAVLIMGTPVTLVMGLLMRQIPGQLGAVVLATAALSIGVGLMARRVARPLGPEQSRWLDAIDAASQSALQPEPDAALRAALFALGKTASSADAGPAIFRNNPKQMLSVDVAGYLHVEPAEAPERLYDLALAEPERTLRAEALHALAVRRPDVRALGAWFDDRGAFSVTLVVDEEGPIGFILLPKGVRTTPMTLEEARAVRALADRISALLAVSSALARSRERELLAVADAQRKGLECERLEHIIDAASGRNVEVAERLAQAVRTSVYSPAARQSLEELERLSQRSSRIALLTAPGVDAAGWAAHAHLSSPRKSGPFLLIDATNPAERALARWQDSASSPLVLGDGGTLVILDVAVLPREVQELLARNASRPSPAEPESKIARGGLFVSARAPLAQLVESGRLSAELARCFADAELRLPTLAERTEDMRALALDVLGRLGLSEQSEPLGIDPGALRLLLEHSWPGNELEFRAVLLRALQHRKSGVLSAEDLFASGFQPKPMASAEVTPLPKVSSRRPRARPLPRAR